MWNYPMETLPQAELQALQLEKLRKTVWRMYQNVPMYRERMQKMRVSPEDIQTLADLKKLPFMVKDDLRDNYPFGLFAVPNEDIVRVHASSGTTGKPTVVGYTKHDLDVWSECVARSIGCAGGTRNDTIQIAYGYGLFTGGLGLHDGATRIGMTVVPMSGGNTKRQIMLMKDFNATMLACTPSYALMLAETMHEAGIKMPNLRAGVFGAEPWTDDMRKRLESLMGIDALDIYGMADLMGPGIASECMEKNGMHIWEDFFLAEIIDPDTGEEVKDGEYGELVISAIDKEGFPVLRYRTRDITRFITQPCPCGRTHKRIARFRGRTDDMIVVKGVNVFPSQVETVLLRLADKGVAPHYMLVVDRVNNTDTLEVQVELDSTLVTDQVGELEKLQRLIAAELHQALLVSVHVRLMEPKSLPRSEGKIKRIIDKRNLFS